VRLGARARFNTICIHAGQIPDPSTGAVITPIYQTSTYVQDALGQHKGYEYGRTQNPTRSAFEANIAAMEHGAAAFGFASGMAATNAVLTLLKAGDHVVVTDNTYGGTYRLFEQILRKYELHFTYADTSRVRQATFDATADLIAAGIDPQRSVLFLQSEVKEHAELHLLLSMVTPLPWLERVPTFKDQQEQLQEKDLNTYGFLGYPLLQTADIIVYRANFVPVGEDQASHLELSREIVRRFNNFYGDVFPEPQPLFTATPKVPGLDGRKMSKSYGNTIGLTASADEVRAAIYQDFEIPRAGHLRRMLDRDLQRHHALRQ